MKKLPKIYQNEILKEINNNKTRCYVVTANELPPIQAESTITLDEIFSGIGYSYNIPIILTTKKGTYNTSLIAKTKKNIITIDNELIPISDIVSIQKKKN